MDTKIKALVLSVVRHSDTTHIITLYSRQHGRMAVAIPAAAGKRNRSNPPLMPLSVITGELSPRPTAGLHRLRQYSLLIPMMSLHLDPLKTTVSLFLAEFLTHLLREQVADTQMWNYIITALECFDKEDNPQRAANFHIVFLWHLLSRTGIMPDTGSYDALTSLPQWLDMRTGTYTTQRPAHSDVVTPRFAHLPLILARINFRNSSVLSLSGEQRYSLLQALIHYYSVHLPGFGNLKSHHILRDVFS